MKHVTFLCFALLLLTLSACATGPTLEESAKNLPPIESGKGRVFFYRRFNFDPEVMSVVLLDGEKVGNALMSGVFFKDLPPGGHRAGTDTNVIWPIVEFNIDAGETKYIKLIPSGRYHVYPELVDARTGEEQAQGLHLIGPEAKPGLRGGLIFLTLFIGMSATIIYFRWRSVSRAEA